MSVLVKFWGVRGSRPSANKKTKIYGGNTACIQLIINNRQIILDGGTGISELGDELINKGDNLILDVFFSHFHWDHIQGLPFFKPLFSENNLIRFYGESKNNLTLPQILEEQMRAPFFPVTMEIMSAKKEFITITPFSKLNLGDGIVVSTFPLEHPNGCLAFKFTKDNYSIVYSTDTETMSGVKRQQYLQFINEVDLLIYDAHYSDSEYYGNDDKVSKVGWGHSTWEEGIRLSREAKVGQLVLFHHREDRSDHELSMIDSTAKLQYFNSSVAREGMLIELGGGHDQKIRLSYSR